MEFGLESDDRQKMHGKSSSEIWKQLSALLSSLLKCDITPTLDLQRNAFRKRFVQATFRSKILAVIFNKAHTLKDWGQTFRPDILLLDDVRDWLGSSIPWILVSAIITAEHLMLAIDKVHLRHRELDCIDVGPDRPGLRYEVQPFASPVTYQS